MDIFLKGIKNKWVLACATSLLLIAAVVLICILRKTVTVVIDGQPTKIVTFKSTVREALNSKGIQVDKKDRITPSLTSKIAEHGTITIKRAVNISLNVDGKELSIQSSEDNVGLMLKDENISLNAEDKVKPEKDTRLIAGMKIEVIRVETKTLIESVPMDYQTVIKNNGSLPNTQKKVVQNGSPGEKHITNSVTYENGKEVSRKLVSEAIVKKPTDKIILQGTYPVMPVSRGGDPLPYYKVIRAKATAYYAVNGVGRTYTSSGRLAVRNPDGYSTVAVDPRVIPYGTKLFVEGYGFAVAADTGTSIVGNTIDVFFNTYKEATNWSVKSVNVYLLQ
jgi:uncharacterized protein YabE (DUF348 family)